jgi:hypothetical protein
MGRMTFSMSRATSMATRAAAAEALARDLPAIAQRLPREGVTGLYYHSASLLCDESALTRFDARLRPGAREVVGAEEALDEGLAKGRACAQLANAQRASFEAALRP